MAVTTSPRLANDTTATRKRGFGSLPCILCGAEATISLDLDDVANFHCGECDESFSADDLRAHLASWTRVLAWIDTAPVAVEE